MSMLTMREPGRKVLAIGAAWGGVRSMVAMKLAGFNVAADFTREVACGV